MLVLYDILYTADGCLIVLYAGECQSCPEDERLPNDRPHNTDRTRGARGETDTDHTTQTEHTLSLSFTRPSDTNDALCNI